MPRWASDWELLCTSEDAEATRSYGYKAVVLVNHSTRELQIANAGAKFGEMHDIWDDIKIFFNVVPNKLSPAKILVDQVIKRLGGEQEDLKYNFNCYGHSLGAVVSDLMMTEIVSRELNVGVSKTYDNPGSKNCVDSAIKQKLFSGSRAPSLEQLATMGEEYNAPPNFINTLQPHLARKIHLVCSDVLSPERMNHSSKNNSKVGSWIQKCKTAVSGFANYLGLSSIATQLNAHKMQHLSQSASPIVETDGWVQSWPAGKIVLRSETATTELLKRSPSTGNDCVVYENKMVEDNVWSYQSVQCRSYGDLVAAYSAVNPQANLGCQAALQPITGTSMLHSPQSCTTAYRQYEACLPLVEQSGCC